MSYTRTHDYTAGTAMTAANIRTNHENLRAYINRGIVVGDIAAGSVDWIHIQAGEYLSVIPAHRFATGNQYAHFVDADVAHQTAISASMKTAGPDSSLWHPVAGHEFRCNVTNSIALVVAYLDVKPKLNDVNTTVTGEADEAYIYLDGDVVEHTRLEFYAADTGTSDAGGSGTSRYRTGTVHALLEGLSAGLHRIEIRMNPRHDLSRIFARSIHVECFEV